MKIISFNVNGIRARIHQLKALITKHQPDVIGLQEIKVADPEFPHYELSDLGYDIYHYGQKGHYGVALLIKQKAHNIQYGLPTDNGDAQKRIIMAEVPSKFGDILIINGYFPQGESRKHEIKFPAKQKFYQDLNLFIQQNNNPGRNIIVMGDMNISPTDLDIGIGEINRKRWLSTGKCSFLPEEREWLQTLEQNGLVDTFRYLNPTSDDKFSWFDYRSKGFNDNRGLRIDLILASHKLLTACDNVGIDLEIRAMDKPSDHAPVWAEFS